MDNSDPCFRLVTSAGISPAIFCHIIAEEPVVSHGQAYLVAFGERLRSRNSSSSTTSSSKKKDPFTRTRYESPFRNQSWYRQDNSSSSSMNSTKPPAQAADPFSSSSSSGPHGDPPRQDPKRHTSPVNDEVRDGTRAADKMGQHLLKI